MAHNKPAPQIYHLGFSQKHGSIAIFFPVDELLVPLPLHETDDIHVFHHDHDDPDFGMVDFITLPIEACCGAHEIFSGSAKKFHVKDLRLACAEARSAYTRITHVK